MTLREQLLQEAKTFCASAGISEARLATIVVNDGKFFDRIKAGGDFTTGTLEKFRAHFARKSAGEKADAA